MSVVFHSGFDLTLLKIENMAAISHFLKQYMKTAILRSFLVMKTVVPFEDSRSI